MGGAGSAAESARPGLLGPGATDPEAARRAAIEARDVGGLPLPQGPGGAPGLTPAPPETAGDVRAARAGAIAAYRAGARAAARVQEAQHGRTALPGSRQAPDDGPGCSPHALGAGTGPEAGPGAEADRRRSPYAGDAPPPAVPRPAGADGPGAPSAAPPGQIADPYGVRTASWHGADPRPTGPRPVGAQAAPAPAADRSLPPAPRRETPPAATGHWTPRPPAAPRRAARRPRSPPNGRGRRGWPWSAR